jgi:hypothetical protein
MTRYTNYVCISFVLRMLLWQHGAASAQTSSDLVPANMVQCEPDSCGIWSFKGKSGTARWDSGPVANLTIEHFDTGGTKGLTGRYVGTRKGSHIEGTFTWSWPGGPAPGGTVNWIAAIEPQEDESGVIVPSSLAVCEKGPDGCSTWMFQGRTGSGRWTNGASSSLSVKHFGPHNVTILRTDTNGTQILLAGLYIGTRKGGHFEGTVTWLWPGHDPNTTGTTTWDANIGPATSNGEAAISKPLDDSVARTDVQSVEIVECENSGCTPSGPNSAVWTLSGNRGLGRFGSGTQPLVIEHIDASSIAVRRVDGNGSLTALYMGRIEGQQITGSVIYYDTGHPNSPRTSVWNGILRGSPTSLTTAVTGLSPSFPFTLHECEGNQCLQSGAQKSIIWTFPAREGQGWLGDHPRPMIIEDLAPGFILARRIDGPELGGLTALYFGEFKFRQITGSVLYFDRNHPDQPRSGTWFGDLQKTFAPEEAMSAPITNASPVTSTNSAVRSPSSGANSLFLDDGCTTNLPEGTQDAFDAWFQGKTAELSGLDENTELNALKWYCKAAKTLTGNDKISKGRAEFEIGELYLEGFILPASHDGGVIRSQQVASDPQTAFTWFLKADAHGNMMATDRLAYLYMGGPKIKGNSQPKDFSNSVSLLKKAAARGDSWAMLNLDLVQSIDGVTYTSQETIDIASAKVELVAKATHDPCQIPYILNEIRKQTPERDVLTVQTGSGETKPDVKAIVFHGDSYVCLAHLGPVTDDDLDHQLWGYFTGAPITYWKYPVYIDPRGGQNWVARSALRQMVSEYADTFGALVSAAKNR